MIAAADKNLIQESLDCLYPNDTVIEVFARRLGSTRCQAHRVEFLLYNLADGERFYSATCVIDHDDCCQWSDVELLWHAPRGA